MIFHKITCARVLTLTRTFTSTTAAAMLSHTNTNSADYISQAPIRKHIPRHKSWPYTEDDFSRSDERDDDNFYDQPRYVAHIDDGAIARLTTYFDTVIPRKGRVLDFCTSWHSWYPDDRVSAVQNEELKVYGIGMNKPELEKNQLFKSHPGRALVLDLNKNPDIRAQFPKDESGELLRFDTATCTVSIDYLNKPVEVLSSLRECMNRDGKVHLIISNRCFPTKAVKIWLELDTDERLQLVGDYLHFAGWKDIEIIDLSARDEQGSATQGKGILGFLRLQHMDPLWVVRGTKE